MMSDEDIQDQLNTVNDRLEKLQLKRQELESRKPSWVDWFNKNELPWVRYQITSLGRMQYHLESMIPEPPVPKVNFEELWLTWRWYSKTLKSYNFYWPTDQIGLYFVTMVGAGFISKAYWGTWNLKQAQMAVSKGLKPNPKHLLRGGVYELEDLANGIKRRPGIIVLSYMFAGLLIGSYTGLIRLKNWNRE